MTPLDARPLPVRGEVGVHGHVHERVLVWWRSLFRSLFMGGMVGRLFREFAAGTCPSPSCCRSCLVPDGHAHDVRRAAAPARAQTGQRTRPGFLGRRIFAAMAHRGYERALAVALSHPRLMLTLTTAGALLGSDLALRRIIPKGFFPEQDTGRLMGFIQSVARTVPLPVHGGQRLESRGGRSSRPIPTWPRWTGFTGGGGGHARRQRQLGPRCS